MDENTETETQPASQTLSPRKLWTAALRSGEYKQGSGMLRRGDKFCCLGVACDLYEKHTGNRIHEKLTHMDAYLYQAMFFELPYEVLRWLGLRTSRGDFEDAKQLASLASLNDSGASFTTLADLIDSEPKGLFVD